MNNTLTNGLNVLEYLAGTGKEYSVKEIGEAFEVPNSHACRLLKTLKESGYVEQSTENRKYRISLKILTLSNACLCRIELRKKVRPFLKDLCRVLEQPVYLEVPLDGKALIIDVEYPPVSTSDLGLAIGGANSLHASVGGKLCAAYMEEDDLEKILAAGEMEKFTEKTITDPDLFREELGRVRAKGVAVTNGEKGEGLCAVGAPIFNCEGGFVAAMGVILPADNDRSEVWETFKKEAREAAEAASYALGFALKSLV